MPKIKKTKTGKYEFRLYGGIDESTGKQKSYHRVLSTKKEAELTLSRLQLEISKKGSIDQINNVLFSEVAAEWLSERKKTVKESTYARMPAMLNNHINKAFGEFRIRTITRKQIDCVVNEWFNATISAYDKWYTYTKSIFEFAVQLGYIEKNPCNLVKMPKKPDEIEEKLPNFWDKSKIDKFFHCLDPVKDIEKIAMFRILFYGGLRREELLALQYSDLVTETNELKIQRVLVQGIKGKQIIQSPKTKDSRRTITLDQLTMDAIKHWRIVQRKHFLTLGINTMNKDQLIFSNRDNNHKSLNQPAKWLGSIIKKNELTKIRLHGTRHSHISMLLAAGVPVFDIQKRVGHSSPDLIYKVYGHLTKQQKLQTVDKMMKYMES